MKFGKWLRRAAAAAVAGCMMLSVSMPVLAEMADVLEEYGTQVQDVETYDIWVKVGDNAEVQLDSSGPKTIGGDAFTGDTFTYDPTAKTLTVAGDNGPLVIRIEESAVDVNIQEYISGGLSVKGAHNVTYNGAQGGGADTNNVLIECSGDVRQEDSVEGDLTVTGAKNVYIAGASLYPVVGGKATIRCSGTVEIEALTKMALGFIGGLDFTQSAGSDCVYWYVDEKADATGEGTPIGSTLSLAKSELTKLGYLKIVPLDNGTDDTVDDAAAPAGDGSAVVGTVLGAAAVWGGYEAVTRVILNNLLPEGAAIPKTQAQLAVLLWNTAGRPEPAGAPVFADVDDATAKAAQWCTEQGYLNGGFKPEKRVTKFRVIRTWNKAFPKS